MHVQPWQANLFQACSTIPLDTCEDVWLHRNMVVVTGTVQVAEIQAGWQKPLDVKGLTWTEPQALGGRRLASVEHIRTTQALLDIVKGMASSQRLALDLLDVFAMN